MAENLDSQMEIEALLPFYVNGTLDEDERARVDDAIGANSGLRTQVEALRQIRASVRATETEHSPGEFGRARLMRDIERDTRNSSSRPMPGALLAASIVAATVALGSILFVSRGGVDYQQASGGAVSQQFTVAFRPDASEREISDMLLEYGLGIVSGPSAVGLYRLDPGTPDDIEALFSELQKRVDVVESIQLE